MLTTYKIIAIFLQHTNECFYPLYSINNVKLYQTLLDYLWTHWAPIKASIKERLNDSNYYFIVILVIIATLSAGVVEYIWLHLCRNVRPHLTPPPIRTPVGHGWWPVILENEILVVKQSVTWQPKWSHDLLPFTLALTRLDRWLKRPEPINQLVVSSPSTNMIVLTVFLLLWQTSTKPYFILKVKCIEIAILETICVQRNYQY